MSLKVQVDLSRCQGHAKCQADCPEVFGADEQGYAVVLLSPVPDNLRHETQRAESGCPERAITLSED